jgi:hypothetical protein
MYLTIRPEIHFYHSIVVAICDTGRHSGPEFIPLSGPAQNSELELAPNEPIKEKSNKPVVASAAQELVTLDLHTRTGLIGRRDLKVTLASLRLYEEEVDGYIDIYAVSRVLERGVPNFIDMPEIGKECLFRFAAPWVCTLWTKC